MPHSYAASFTGLDVAFWPSTHDAIKLTAVKPSAKSSMTKTGVYSAISDSEARVLVTEESPVRRAIEPGARDLARSVQEPLRGRARPCINTIIGSRTIVLCT